MRMFIWHNKNKMALQRGRRALPSMRVGRFVPLNAPHLGKPEHFNLPFIAGSWVERNEPQNIGQMNSECRRLYLERLAFDIGHSAVHSHLDLFGCTILRHIQPIRL